ncbi:Ti-type conjugative transfer relaxase TraA [Caulobacter sp. BP25]|uniref:Ti-type conjugative transfer relaxase TraA n=1 Tax=Caulobacter sp. BP25 TaxID=2048900 RepID=UPI000C12C987|nr:Ti-type conjugative transfer relaxase TraA [Caulobacter sp. BP25]PHY22886.1 Ti-type conjugative transfer relaxase TraA [Caulobacter sp. BP25]
MAIYHFSVKIISRANGRSAVAAAAYRAASALHDLRIGRTHDFTNKTGVVCSEILAPAGSPARWSDRETLWNEVEKQEARKDAQLTREVEFALPRELDQAQGVALARSFVEREFVARGMVADLNVHWDFDDQGQPKPHAHVMLSLREATPEGFGLKVRAWNDRGMLESWRESWANHVNQRLAELDIDARVDHRSLEAQGLDLEPQQKIGAADAGRAARGEEADQALRHREIARRNGERMIADPSLALEAITQQQSTFTDLDLQRFVHRHSDDKAQFDQLVRAVKGAPNLVALGKDGAGHERYTSRAMLEVERRLEQDATMLAERKGHRVSPAASLRAREGLGVTMSHTQAAAFDHVLGAQDLALVVGYAGSGKSTMLGAAQRAWTAQGYRVRGAALSGMAAEGLQNGSGIPARTIASLEHAWAQGRDPLTAGDVLVIDEAGLIGSRQMQRVLAEATQAGAKVVLVGDAEQLQAIEAGAAFRALTERHGAVEVTEIQRQREGWQRDATKALATGRTREALEGYKSAGMVRGYATREDAASGLVASWAHGRHEQPELSQVMLAHTRADVARLNELAREQLAGEGVLGAGQLVATERGARTFAQGDRVMFLRNERSLGVKNGSLATLVSIADDRMVVRLDGEDNRRLEVDLKAYNHIDHGYAATLHKSQGMTVDWAHLLVTDGLDRHAAYVGLSRHRQAVTVHYGADDFRSWDEVVRTLGRDRSKDTSLDYAATFAERRWLPAEPIRIVKSMVAELWERASRFGEGIGLGAAEVRLQAPTSHNASEVSESPHDEVLGAREQIGSDLPLPKQADAFVDEWSKLNRAWDASPDDPAVEAKVMRLIGELEKDPALQGALASRRAELGLAGPKGWGSLWGELKRKVENERDNDLEI